MHPWVYHGDWVHLPTYLTCLAVGLWAATFAVRREALRSGLPVGVVMDLVVWLVPTVLVGARLLHVVWVAPRFYAMEPWAAVAYAYGGFVFYGGFGAGALLLWRWARWQGLDPWALADVFAPGTALGLVFGRLGCLGAGCCWGKPITWPFGVALPWGVRAYARGYLPEPLLGTSLHPTPLYEALGALVLFVGLSSLRARRPVPGSAALAFVAVYGVLRTCLEAFRGDAERGVYLGGWVSTSQVVGSVSAVVAVALWFRLRRAAPVAPV
jgi:phosphatidylglycerol:prolipoprotein diacylglycerol transferase